MPSPWIRLAAGLAIATASPALAQVSFFEGSFADALARAAVQKKPLLVDVVATWCAPCHELDAKVLATPEAALATSGYLVVRIDGEAGDGPAILERYNVVGYPTLLFLSSDGEEIDRLFGETTLADFTQACRDFPAGKGTLADAEKRFAERPTDFELAHAIGVRHAIKGHEFAAKAYFSLVETALKGLKSTPRLPVPKEGPQVDAIRRVNDLQTQSTRRAEELVAEGQYTLARYLFLRGRKDYHRAKIALTDLRRKSPKSKVSRRAVLDLAMAFHGLKDDKQTRASLDQYLAENGQSAQAVNAYAWFCYKQGFQLDRGIEVAAAALDKEPREAGLWDTLAELYAAKGDRTGAITAAEKALSLKPDDAYYQKQRERFASR